MCIEVLVQDCWKAIHVNGSNYQFIALCIDIMLVIDARCTCSNIIVPWTLKSSVCSRERQQCICLHTYMVYVHSQVVSQYTCCCLPVCSCSKAFSVVCNFLAFFSLLRLFNEEALKDYKRFRKQEVRDLKEVLAAHIKTQIVLCKLVCLTA